MGTIGPGKSFAVPAEPFEQAIYRMAGFHALAPPRSYHGRDFDRWQRVEEGKCSQLPPFPRPKPPALLVEFSGNSGINKAPSPELIPRPAVPVRLSPGNFMRISLAILCAAVSISSAAAQGGPAPNKVPGDSPHSTGRTDLPNDGQAQPQGSTGPLETGSGGAPAESPHGQTPAGMQAAPEGSSKTIVDTVPAAQR